MVLSDYSEMLKSLEIVFLIWGWGCQG